MNFIYRLSRVPSSKPDFDYSQYDGKSIIINKKNNYIKRDNKFFCK